MTFNLLPDVAAWPSRDTPCLYTISIDPKGLRTPAIRAGHDWVRERFRSVTALVGDGPLIERTAHITGTPLEAVRNRTDALLATLPSDSDICQVSALALTTDFQQALEDVAAAKAAAPALARAIRADAKAYVRRVRRRGELAIVADAALACSIDYIATEIATYLCLARRGFTLDTYLGEELGVLRRFITGDFTGLLPPLERRVFIGLRDLSP